MRRKILSVMFALIFMFVMGASAKANPIGRIASGAKTVAVSTAHVVKKVVEVPINGGESVVHHVKDMF